jgi:hypothetical protein
MDIHSYVIKIHNFDPTPVCISHMPQTIVNL